jgi:hypothetical protein
VKGRCLINIKYYEMARPRIESGSPRIGSRRKGGTGLGIMD